MPSSSWRGRWGCPRSSCSSSSSSPCARAPPPPTSAGRPLPTAPSPSPAWGWWPASCSPACSARGSRTTPSSATSGSSPPSPSWWAASPSPRLEVPAPHGADPLAEASGSLGAPALGRPSPEAPGVRAEPRDRPPLPPRQRRGGPLLPRPPRPALPGAARAPRRALPGRHRGRRARLAGGGRPRPPPRRDHARRRLPRHARVRPPRPRALRPARDPPPHDRPAGDGGSPLDRPHPGPLQAHEGDHPRAAEPRAPTDEPRRRGHEAFRPRRPPRPTQAPGAGGDRVGVGGDPGAAGRRPASPPRPPLGRPPPPRRGTVPDRRPHAPALHALPARRRRGPVGDRHLGAAHRGAARPAGHELRLPERGARGLRRAQHPRAPGARRPLRLHREPRVRPARRRPLPGPPAQHRGVLPAELRGPARRAVSSRAGGGALTWRRRSSTRHVSGLVRATAVVFASSVSAMGLGFLKNILAAYYFGTSGAMDAYLLALLLPDAAAQLARTGAFNFIPLFSAEHSRSESAAWAVASRLLTYWLLVLLVTLGLAFVVSGPALVLIAPGLAPGPRELALSYTRGLFLMALPMGVARILAVALHAQRRFLAAGASDVAFQLASTAFLVAFHDTGGAALVWAQVFGAFVQLLVAALGLLKERRNLRPILDLGATSVRRMVRLTLPIYLGDSGDKINLIVTRAFASLLPAGAVSALQYAYTLVEGLQCMLTGSRVTALFPYLSVRFAQADERGARVGLHRAVVFAALVSVPLSASLWLAADPLVVVLFERGSFDEHSTGLTASALRLFAPALVALALNGILGSAFHARQDTLTPMRAGLLRVGCNMALCATLAPSLGHRGIALAATVSLYLKLVVLVRSLDRVHARHELMATGRALARPLPAVALMVLVMYPASLLARLPRVLEGHPPAALAALALPALSSSSAGLWLFCRRELTLPVALVHRALRHPRAVEGAAPPRWIPRRSRRWDDEPEAS